AIRNAGTAAGLITPRIVSRVFMQTRSARHDVFVKDYVPCLSMPDRHTLEASGAPAFALLRCGGGDGKRLARGAKAACLTASAKPSNPRSRRRNWIFLARTHGQVSSLDRCRPEVPRRCARVVAKRGRSSHESARHFRQTRIACRRLASRDWTHDAGTSAGVSASRAERARKAA